MNSYQVHVKIKNRPQAHYEFRWEGSYCRSGVQEIEIVVEAEDEADAAHQILKTSENTLEVVNMFMHQTQQPKENKAKEEDYGDTAEFDWNEEYVKKCIPVKPSEIIERVSVSVSNN